MKKEEFELKKIKIDPAGKVTVEYSRIVRDKEVVYADDVIVTSPRLAHPDLEAALGALTTCLADANDLRIHRKDIKIMPKIAKALKDESVQAFLKILDKEVYDSVHVSGVSIQGTLEDGSCIITGKRDILHTGGALNSPKISFNGDSFGFENTVKNRVQVVINEAFAYVYENKSTNPELFAKEEEPKKEVA